MLGAPLLREQMDSAVALRSERCPEACGAASTWVLLGLLWACPALFRFHVIRCYTKDRMRIALIAPLAVSVPPPGYGGTEQVVSVLAEGLVKQGHEVTLFASGDSVTKARLHSVRSASLRASGINYPAIEIDAAHYDSIGAVACFQRADEFDIIHSHASPVTMIMANLVSTPLLITLHNPINEAVAAAMAASNGYYNTLSLPAKQGLPDRGYLGAVHNDIDVATFPFNASQREGYLLFLGRVSHDKGTHLAIEVAKRLNRELLIAGNVNQHDQEYFDTMVAPHIDGKLIRYFGEATREQTRQLFSQADCFLFPILWEELFGLVMIEAMACGTPVIALNRGSVPEVVVDGQTGFIVDTVDEMVDAVGRTGEIDRRRCREHVERHFAAPRMVDDYLSLYQRILDMERQG